MINFDALPQQNPFAIPDDIYIARITEALMKKPKDASKPPYLNLKYDLFNKDGKKAGTLYDIMAESDSSVVQYKIGRFLRACGIPLTGSMELSDIAKIVMNKDIAVDVKTSAKKGEDARTQVDLFGREGYYRRSEFDEMYAVAHAGEQPPMDTSAVVGEIPTGIEEEVEFGAMPEPTAVPIPTEAGTANTDTSEY